MKSKHLTNAGVIVVLAILAGVFILGGLTGYRVGKSVWKQTPEEVAARVEAYFAGQQMSYEFCGRCHDYLREGRNGISQLAGLGH